MSQTRKDVDSSVQQSLSELEQASKRTGLKAVDREPLVNEIPDHGFRLAVVSGTPRCYTRIGSQRYYWDLTAV